MVDEKKSCCFSGHRFIKDSMKESLKATLKDEIIKLYHLNYRIFYNGGAIGFDSLACDAVFELKSEYPDISLCMILPCKDQHHRWKEKDKAKYIEILKAADDIQYICEHYVPGCMQARNDVLIGQSDFCICYLKNKMSGTAYTVKRAKEAGIPVLNLAVAEQQNNNSLFDETSVSLAQ
ncbi:MAG: hypothetical protein BGN88_02635 [Clostridiales bacterium 43-6]|nr:MAG: hypothetical protein BGN88_02635 [Clostridiales bacterium 43-6]